jgi:prevent-host-death family protein
MAAYNIYEAKTNFSALVEKAVAGEEVIVAKSGKPLLKLVLLDKEPKQDEAKYLRPAPGFAKGEFSDLIAALDEPWPEDVQRAFGMID